MITLPKIFEMTAIVGVLNKQAIAIAADSAETIGDGIKIYNKAKKIFTLSKRHPVGIAIYGNAAFNKLVPWEIIIKSFRENIGNNSKDKIIDYSREFLDYLGVFRSQNISLEDIRKVNCQDVVSLFSNVIIGELPNSDSNSLVINPKDMPLLKNILESINEKVLSSGVSDTYKEISYNDFIDEIFNIEKLLESCINNTGSNYRRDYRILLLNTLYNLYISSAYNRDFTGVAFFGYGDKDIYPEMYNVKIFNCFGNKPLLWEIDRKVEINHYDNPASICPMAQTDVMEAYMSGIDPLIKDTFIACTRKVFEQVFKEAYALSPDIVDLDTIMLNYEKFIMEFTSTNKIQPLLQTVATMEKEDLAELAENLIYQTSLKRRITPNMETVGGPIDVAIVSKGDGFIWIKRKHYFDPALNNCFFDNYYNKTQTK